MELEGSLDHLGRVWEGLGRLLDPLGRFLAVFGTLKIDLFQTWVQNGLQEALWNDFGSICGGVLKILKGVGKGFGRIGVLFCEL